MLWLLCLWYVARPKTWWCVESGFELSGCFQRIQILYWAFLNSGRASQESGYLAEIKWKYNIFICLFLHLTLFAFKKISNEDKELGILRSNHIKATRGGAVYRKLCKLPILLWMLLARVKTIRCRITYESPIQDGWNFVQNLAVLHGCVKPCSYTRVCAAKRLHTGCAEP